MSACSTQKKLDFSACKKERISRKRKTIDDATTTVCSPMKRGRRDEIQLSEEPQVICSPVKRDKENDTDCKRFVELYKTPPPSPRGVLSPSKTENIHRSDALSSKSSKVRFYSEKKETPSCRRKVDFTNTPKASPSASPFVKEALLSGQKRNGGVKKNLFHFSVTERLVCRNEEIETIKGFVETQISQNAGGSLYISGPPGTGKSACLAQVIDSLQDRIRIGFINCMKASSAQSVLADIYSILMNKSAAEKKSARTMLDQLADYVTTCTSPVVLILDEIDQLDSKGQEILYALFELPHLNNSHLILIGVANALDLTERLLPRLSVRVEKKPQLLHFRPYDRSQIVEILRDRLGEVSKQFDLPALLLLASKVAATSGDLRRALDLCRRAAEVAENGSDGVAPARVTLQHVVRVVGQMEGQSSLPLQLNHVIVLTALFQGGKAMSVGQLLDDVRKAAQQCHLPPPESSELTHLCQLLQSTGLVAIKGNGDFRLRKVSLSASQQYIEKIIRDNPICASLLND